MTHSKICIGTAQLGMNYGISNNSSKMKTNDFNKIIKYSIANNINFIDTANTYGNSENLIGKTLKKIDDKSTFKVISKFNNLRNIQKKKIREKIFHQIELSIKKLGTKKLYAALIHNVKDLESKKKKEIYNVFLNLKKKGLVEKIGFSAYETKDLKKYLIKYKFDIVQFPFSIFDQRILDKKIQNLLKRKKIEVHIRSIFLQGLLLLPAKKIPKKFNLEENLKKWNNYLLENKINNIDACIKFILRYNFYKKIVIGFNNFSQFKHVVNRFKILKKNKMKINFKNFENKSELINPSKW